MFTFTTVFWGVEMAGTKIRVEDYLDYLDDEEMDDDKLYDCPKRDLPAIKSFRQKDHVKPVKQMRPVFQET